MFLTFVILNTKTGGHSVLFELVPLPEDSVCFADKRAERKSDCACGLNARCFDKHQCYDYRVR